MTSKLWIDLPPLSPDYSGVAAALYEFGGMIVIHDASGCTGNYTGYDEPRWYDEKSMVYCSGLREMEAIMGNDDILTEKIISAAKELNPKFIAILGSPVPMLIGTDFKGISTEIENNLNIHVMGFNTTGLSYYNIGIEMAGVELIKRFSNENVEKTVNSVNLIGATPLDFNDLKNIQSIESFFEDTDIKINSKLFMNSSLEDVKNLFKGDFNIPLSSGGYKISKYLNKKYSMPFLPCIPIGTGKSFIKAYNTFISKDKSYINKNFERREKLLILGDQLISNSIRNELYDMGFNSKICVGTMFGLEKDISFPCDLNIVSESHLREIFKSSDFKKIIADPIYKAVLSENGNVDFIEMPHLAVSGKISFGKTKNFIGTDMVDLMYRALE